MSITGKAGQGRAVLFNFHSTNVPVIFFLLIGLFLNLSFINSPGTSDVPIFERWSTRVIERGLFPAYCNSRTDYPPLSFVVLGGFASLLGPSALSVKFSIFSFWIFYACLVLFLSRLASLPFWAGALLASNPAIMVNAQFLGYLDVYFAPFLLLSLYLLREPRLFFWSGMAFGAAIFLKWQPLILLPFFPIFLWRFGRSLQSAWRAVSVWLVGVGAISTTVVLIYTLAGDPGCVVRALERTSALSFKLVSGNALNVNWIATYFLHLLQPETFRPLMEGAAKYIRADLPLLRLFNFVGVALGYILFVGILARRGKSLADLAMAAIGGGLAYFIFAYSVHENYSFLVIVPATFLVLLNYKNLHFWHLFAILSLFHMLNLILFYGLSGQPGIDRVVAGIDTSIIFAMFIIVFFVFYVRYAVKQMGRLESVE